MISGKTTLLPLFGYPTEAFKAPLIYNPWFESKGIDSIVVPLGVKPEDFETLAGNAMKDVCGLTNPVQPTLHDVIGIFQAAW